MLAIPDAVKGFVILICVFAPLEKLLAMHKQKLLRRGWLTDIFYYFSGYVIGRGTTQALIILAFLSQSVLSTLALFFSQLPIVLQVVIAVLIGDLCYYFAHRSLHTIPWLWQFHTIHHSSTNIDWLATVRVHPFDQVFTKVCQMIPLYLLGLSAEALTVYAVISSGIAFFIHANIGIRLGFLKWAIATPEFHHWHHANAPELYQKNFSAQIPLWDWVFGTLYMPEHKSPQAYGTEVEMSTNYWKQFTYPFKFRSKSL